MRVLGLTPILNVSDLAESFEWFEKLGWRKLWDWGDPPSFGGVGCWGSEVFLCVDGQGGRGKSDLAVTTGAKGAESADRGVWMSVWVEDVDAVHRRCIDHGIEVTHPPTDEPWNVREMHVRHPDGHVFRISRGLGSDDSDTDAHPPLKVERVDVRVRLESRLVALLVDLAAHKGMTLSGLVEETVLHSFEPVSGGVASPHRPETFDVIEELKTAHGIDYDTHASYRFVD
jgi:catechol 2,3-dioxygenase-like lactoylglutathione lyase family enzyme